MSPCLFNVYIDGVVREVNIRVLGKGLELPSANRGRFEINPLLFADDTALMALSKEKLCRLVSEFGRVCERRKLRVIGSKKRGRVDDLSFFEYLSQFCFLSIEFHCTFSISYKRLPCFVQYYCI